MEQLRLPRAAVFCGIGNPLGFRRTLTGCGVAVPDDRFRVYPDHHAYQPPDCEAIGQWAKSVKSECLLTTHKDLVKIPSCHLGGIPLWALEIELQFEDGSSELQLAEQLRSAIARGPLPGAE